MSVGHQRAAQDAEWQAGRLAALLWSVAERAAGSVGCESVCWPANEYLAVCAPSREKW